MKKLYLAFENKPGYEDPFAYIMADDEDSARLKALEILQASWDDCKVGHEKFYREALGYGKRKIPTYESQNGLRPESVKEISVHHPYGQIHVC